MAFGLFGGWVALSVDARFGWHGRVARVDRGWGVALRGLFQRGLLNNGRPALGRRFRAGAAMI
jgi:hypothetical protein